MMKSCEKNESVFLTCAKDISPTPIRWLWKGWLAKGKFHILAGAPGTGKTTIMMSLASILSAAESKWPDGSAAPQGGILVWSGEDDPADTLVPRLNAMNADLSNVHFISGVGEGSVKRAFDPAADIALLLERIEKSRPVLLIIDPIVSAVSNDSHKNSETRRSLQPIVDLALQYDLAVMGISHFSKGTSGRDPVERITGSLAFGALARVVLVAAKLTEEKGGGRIFCRAKSNIGSDKGGFKYEIDLIPFLEDGETSRVTWGDPVTQEAKDLLDETVTTNKSSSALDAAMKFLREEVSDTGVAAKDLKEAAEMAGHSWKTLIRAKDKLGIVAVKLSMKGGWMWSFPKKPTFNEDTQPWEVDTFDVDGHLRQI